MVLEHTSGDLVYPDHGKPTFLLDSGTGNRTQHKHAEARPTTRWPRSFVKTKREAHGYCLLGIIGLEYSNFVKAFLTHKALKPRNMSKVDSSPPPPWVGALLVPAAQMWW